jgi:hypothetical protein
MIEKLKELANKKSFTKAEKDWIIEVSKDGNIHFDPKKGCSNCWIDQVLKLYGIAQQSGLIQRFEESELDYILLPHIDVRLHGIRYNNATLDEAKAKYLISLGFEKWFLKIKSEDEHNTVN